MKGKIFVILCALFILLILLIIGSLIFWGLGNLVIIVFKIKYNWTILHGMVCELMFVLLKDIFSKEKEV